LGVMVTIQIQRFIGILQEISWLCLVLDPSLDLQCILTAYSSDPPRERKQFFDMHLWKRHLSADKLIQQEFSYKTVLPIGNIAISSQQGKYSDTAQISKLHQKQHYWKALM
jgi:hypothetical protein